MCVARFGFLRRRRNAAAAAAVAAPDEASGRVRREGVGEALAR